MSQYNLTQRERQLLIQLLNLSKHSKDHFEARLVEPAFSGPRSELAQLDFGGAGLSMEITKRDLRVFKHTADLASKGNMIGEFGERLAA